MTRTTIAVCLLILLAGFIGFHTYEIYALSKDVNQLCDSIESALDSDDWDNVCSGTKELQNRWNKSRLWASLTIDTAKIEEIEISLRQSLEYAKLHSKEDFVGEYYMFKLLVEHLPHQEGFAIEELL